MQISTLGKHSLILHITYTNSLHELYGAIIVYVTKSSEQGAQTQIFLAASQTIDPAKDSGTIQHNNHCENYGFRSIIVFWITFQTNLNDSGLVFVFLIANFYLNSWTILPLLLFVIKLIISQICSNNVSVNIIVLSVNILHLYILYYLLTSCILYSQGNITITVQRLEYQMLPKMRTLRSGCGQSVKHSQDLNLLFKWCVC